MENNEKGVLRQLWDTFFSKAWPLWVGGILLAFLNVLLFLIRSPWSGSGTYMSWGENLYQKIGLFGLHDIMPVVLHPYGLPGTLTLLGAFTGALMGRDFAVRVPPFGEIVKSFIGGALMALGATLGIGCTIGGFLSECAALSGGAIVLAIGFLIGIYVAAHVKLRPVDFSAEGIFLAGLAHSPKMMDETISQAKAAAGRACAIISSPEYISVANIATLDVEICAGCGMCVSVCPYSAPELIWMNGRQVAHINSALCKGCGSCSTVCPSGAMQQLGFREDQTLVEINEALGTL